MLVKLYQITEDSMNSKPFEEGSLYVTQDTNRCFLDPIDGDVRILISGDPIIFSTESDRENLLSPIPNKLYIVLEGNALYIYNGGAWVNINASTSQVNLGQIVNMIYPVGSIYISVNSTNPVNIFGGTWQQIENRFLLAAGSNYTAGTTGGEATHKLTASEMPSHTHTWKQESCTNPGGHTHQVGADHDSGQGTYGYSVHITGSSSISGAELTPTTSSAGEHTHTTAGSNTSTGGDMAHNNMPPYLVVYMWIRTA